MGYFGSKATSGLCQMHLGLQPPHDVYVETHLRGGVFMKRKVPVLQNTAEPRGLGPYVDTAPRSVDESNCRRYFAWS